jgi:phosphomannomutase
LALKNNTISELFEKLPKYHMLKEKIKIDNNLDFIYIKNKLKSTFKNFSFNEIDGLKIENNSSWVHDRKSNTEPIIRIYIESKNKQDSKALFRAVKKALR